jgi:hypothetical protein
MLPASGETTDAFRATLPVRRAPRSGALLGVAGAAMVFLTFALMRLGFAPRATLAVAALACVVFLVALAPQIAALRQLELEVRADGTGLFIAGAHIARNEIYEAIVVPSASERFVRVTTRDHVHWIRCADPEQAEALLRAMETDARHKTATFKVGLLASPRARVVNVGIFFLMVLLTALTDSAVPLLLVPVAWFANAIPRRVVVGADGVLIAWLRWQRWIPYAEIKSTVRTENTLKLLLASGDIVQLPADRDADELRARVDAALAGHRRDADDLDALTGQGLARQGRVTAEWIASLRAAAGRDTSYRSAGLDPERLWRLVEDGDEPPPTRAAAAVALAQTGPDARPRLLRVAEAVAEPRLRVAIDSAARDDDAALSEALDELSHAPAPTGKAAETR